MAEIVLSTFLWMGVSSLYVMVVEAGELCRIATPSGYTYKNCPETCCRNYYTKTEKICCGKFPMTTMFAASSIGGIMIMGCLFIIIIYLCARKIRQIRRGNTPGSSSNRRNRQRSRRSPRNGQTTPDISIISPPPYEAVTAPPLYSEMSAPFPEVENALPPKYTETAEDKDTQAESRHIPHTAV